MWQDYAYGRNAIYDHGHHGNAILSRFPIVSAENQDVSTHRFEQRGLLHCEVALGELHLHCLCVHFGLYERGRRRQLSALTERVQRLVPARAPLIVAGDFNTLAPRALRHVHEKRVEQALGPQYINALPRLSWSYDTSHADPGDGLGFLPKLHRAGVRFRARLDYIFATNVSVTSSAMHDLPGSDHRPLIAAFAVQAVPVVALVESIKIKFFNNAA